MKLLIIRHGQTDGNVKGLVQGAGLDLPLNETGRAQAAAAAEKLLSLYLPVIYSSTMLRARQTAKLSPPASVARRLPSKGWKKCISAKRKACFRKTLTGFTATCSR